MLDWFRKIFTKDSPDAEPVVLDLATDGRYGIATLTPMMQATLNLGLAIVAAGRDGLSWGDGFTLAKPIMDAGATFKHVGQAKLELFDLTPSEVQTLTMILMARLPDLPSHKAAIIIQAALELAPQLVNFVQVTMLVLSLPAGVDLPQAVAVRSLETEPPPAPVPVVVAAIAAPAAAPPPPGPAGGTPQVVGKTPQATLLLNTPVAPGSQAIPQDIVPKDERPGGAAALGADTVPG